MRAVAGRAGQCDKGLSGGSQPFPGAGQKPPPPICAVAESQKDQMFCKKKVLFVLNSRAAVSRGNTA